jgi:3-oxoadipate enol-lactonase
MEVDMQRRRNIDTPLGRVAVEVSGSGPWVVLLHGSGSSRRSFEPQVEELAGDYTCVAWDAPGYGESADPEFQPTVWDYAGCVAAVIERLTASRPVHLVGVSWGGLVATGTAAAYPHLISSLALLGPSFGDAGDDDAQRATGLRLQEFHEDLPSYVSARVATLSRGSPTTATYRRVAETMRELRSPGFDYALESMVRSDLSGAVRRLDLPLCLMWGAEDSVTGEQCRTLAPLLPAARCMEVPEAGHLVNQDQPGAVNRALRSFWASI